MNGNIWGAAQLRHYGRREPLPPAWRRQALNVKPAPWGGHYIIHIEDVITDTGKHGLSIYNETLREADHETPASRVDTLLKTVIARTTNAIGEVMADAINRNREGQQ